MALRNVGFPMTINQTVMDILPRRKLHQHKTKRLDCQEKVSFPKNICAGSI